MNFIRNANYRKSWNFFDPIMKKNLTENESQIKQEGADERQRTFQWSSGRVASRNQ